MTSIQLTSPVESRLLPIAGSTLPLGKADTNAHDRWGKDLARLRTAGFEAVDLVDSWLRIDLLGAPELATLRQALDDTGLALVGVSVIRASMIDPEDGLANLDRILDAIDAAAQLGAPTVSVGFHRPLRGAQLEGPFWLVPHPEDAADDAAFERAAQRLATACSRAAEHGIAISLELHEATLLDRSERVLRLLHQTGAPNLGVNLDVGNLVRVPGRPAEPWDETIAQLAEHVNYWHIKNFRRLGHPSHAPVLTDICTLRAGVIDYRSALRTVIGAGFGGPLIVEHYGGDALSMMADGRVYLEQLLSEESMS